MDMYIFIYPGIYRDFNHVGTYNRVCFYGGIGNLDVRLGLLTWVRDQPAASPAEGSLSPDWVMMGNWACTENT